MAIKAHALWWRLSGEDRAGLTELDVAGRSAAAEFRVVHARQIVQDQTGHFRRQLVGGHEFAPFDPRFAVGTHTDLYLVVGQLEGQGLGIEVTQAAKEELAKIGYDPQLGARPMRRAIQRHIEDALSEAMPEVQVDAVTALMRDYEAAAVDARPKLAQAIVRRLETAKDAARAAGVLVRSFTDDLHVEFKTPRDLVTAADVAAQELIVEKIHTAFPDDEIMAEALEETEE